MKKLVLLVSLIASVALSAENTGTNLVVSGPIVDAIRFASSEGATNWMATAFGTMSTGEDVKTGFGLAALYKLNDFVAPMLRFDYYDDRIFNVSANLNLQAPITLFGKLTAIPFAFSGISTPLTGKNNDDMTLQGMFGIGLAIPIGKKVDFVFDVEKWTSYADEQIRFGFLYKF